MLSEVNILGVYVAPIVIYALAALPVLLVLRSVLSRMGTLRRVWHPALFEFAVYLIVLSALVLFV